MQVTSIPQSFVTFSPIEPADYTLHILSGYVRSRRGCPACLVSIQLRLNKPFAAEPVFKLTGLRLSLVPEN